MKKTTFVPLALLVLAASPAAPQDEPVEMRVYDIESITEYFQEKPVLANLSLYGDFPGTSIVSSGEDNGLFPFKMTGEDTANMLKLVIVPGAWERPGADISYQNGKLIVRNSRAVHEKIQEFLDLDCDPRRGTVTLEAAIVAIEPALLAKIRAGGRPSVLSAEQAKRVLEAAREGKSGEVIKSCRFSTLPGRRAGVEDLVQTTYIRDYDVQISTGESPLDPVVDAFSTGVSIAVRPRIRLGGDAIAMELSFERAEPGGMEERTLKMRQEIVLTEYVKNGETNYSVPKSPPIVEALEGRIQLPRITRQAVKTTVVARNGETVVVGSAPCRGRDLLFLITPTFPGPVHREGRRYRVWDLSLFMRGVADQPSSRVGVRHHFPCGPLAGASFTLDEPRAFLMGDEIMGLKDRICKKIAPETWTDARNSIGIAPGYQLLVCQSPEVLDEIDRFMKQLLEDKVRTFTTEAIVVAFPGGAPSEWAGARLVDSERIEKLLEAAYERKGVKLLAKGEVTSISGVRAYSAGIKEESYVDDYEPMVDSSASMYDPVLCILCSGFSLDVRSLPGLEPGQVLVELKAGLAQGEIKEQEVVFNGLGPIQKPYGDGLHWEVNVTCEAGKWTRVRLESRGKGKEAEDVAFFLRARPNVPR